MIRVLRFFFLDDISFYLRWRIYTVLVGEFGKGFVVIVGVEFGTGGVMG